MPVTASPGVVHRYRSGEHVPDIRRSVLSGAPGGTTASGAPFAAAASAVGSAATSAGQPGSAAPASRTARIGSDSSRTEIRSAGSRTARIRADNGVAAGSTVERITGRPGTAGARLARRAATRSAVRRPRRPSAHQPALFCAGRPPARRSPRRRGPPDRGPLDHGSHARPPAANRRITARRRSRAHVRPQAGDRLVGGHPTRRRRHRRIDVRHVVHRRHRGRRAVGHRGARERRGVPRYGGHLGVRRGDAGHRGAARPAARRTPARSAVVAGPARDRRWLRRIRTAVGRIECGRDPVAVGCQRDVAGRPAAGVALHRAGGPRRHGCDDRHPACPTGSRR